MSAIRSCAAIPLRRWLPDRKRFGNKSPRFAAGFFLPHPTSYNCQAAMTQREHIDPERWPSGRRRTPGKCVWV
jgi:hypothetical protein